ncbi:MAG TPA: phosphotransferase [Mycobacteriales bacterium]|jgi:hygromycin-B 4-O-kinase|nr:phosphotransferase [Mycobacteriales bacterium]
MPEKLPQSQAQQFVRDRYGDRAGALTLVGAGEWSQAYAFTLDGRELVVRFGGYVADFRKDRLMAGYSSAGLPIPRVVELGEAPGGFFVVAQRAHGQFLDDLDAAGFRAALPALLSALDSARDIDVSGTTGYGGWQPDRTAPHQSWADTLLHGFQDQPGSRTHGWRARLEDSPTGAGPFDQGLAAMRSLVRSCPDGRQIIHGDLLNRNVLVDGGRVSAVLDWGNSMYGDGLYDLAWLLFWQPWYPAWHEVDLHGIIDEHLEARPAAERAGLDERLRCYQVHIGLDSQTYNAFTGRWDNLAQVTEQTLALL